MLHDTPGGIPPPPAAKPTLELLDALAPDDEEVRELAAGAGFEEPAWEVRHDADREAAAWIALHVPPGGPARRATLARLLEAAIAAALPACREAQERFRLLRIARDEHRTLLATRAPAAAVAAARARLAEAYHAAAVAGIEAALAVRRVHGAERAIRFARRGEPWIDPEIEREADELFGRPRAAPP